MLTKANRQQLLIIQSDDSEIDPADLSNLKNNHQISEGLSHERQSKQQQIQDKNIRSTQMHRFNDQFESKPVIKNFFDEDQIQHDYIYPYSPTHHKKTTKLSKLEKQKVELEPNNIQTSLLSQQTLKIGKIFIDSSDQEQISAIDTRKQNQNTESDIGLSINAQEKPKELSNSVEEEQNVFMSKEARDQQQERPRKYSNKKEKRRMLFSSLTLTPIKSSDAVVNRSFAFQGIPQGKVLKLNLKRDRSGMNRFWPQYDIFFAEDCKHLLSFQKKGVNTTSNFSISLSRFDLEKGPSFTGKVRSNFSGSVYNVFNRGSNPSKCLANETVRHLLATIVFYTGSINDFGPRNFLVYVMKPPYKYWDLDGIIMQEEQVSLDRLYEVRGNKEKIMVFNNRKPIWCQKKNGYVMDFEGRIEQPSVKNFIVQDQQENEVLMFGRLGQDLFALHVSFPLCPLIATGIVIANFDSKVNCE